MVVKEIPVGSLRIKAHDLRVYEKTAKSWRLSKQKCSSALNAIHLFDGQRKFDFLIDQNDPRFLKGMLTPSGKTVGARINSLPNGEKLEKAFSLFAPGLQLHDQDSHDHWDVLYKNAGGTYSYVYSSAKREAHRAAKYKKVDKLDLVYGTLIENVHKGLKNKNDTMAVVMYTLLNTHMRVGNETYYKTHNHKGLTTLTKNDISVKGKNISFNYVGKDGVPIKISKEFDVTYVKRMRDLLKQTKKDAFVFANKKTGHPIAETHFKKAFKRYCGEEFYPHIVRSHYATMQVKSFLKHHKKASKSETQKFLYSVAAELGHKRYSTKRHAWEDSYTVTLHSYVPPVYITKVKKML